MVEGGLGFYKLVLVPKNSFWGQMYDLKIPELSNCGSGISQSVRSKFYGIIRLTI